MTNVAYFFQLFRHITDNVKALSTKLSVSRSDTLRFLLFASSSRWRQKLLTKHI